MFKFLTIIVLTFLYSIEATSQTNGYSFNYREIIYQPNAFPFKFNGKFGLIDKNGDYLLNANFDSISILQNYQYNHFLIIGKRNSEGKLLFGLVDDQGKIYIEPSFTNIIYNGNNSYFGVNVTDATEIYYIKDPTKKFVAEQNTFTEYVHTISIIDKITSKKRYGFSTGWMMELNNDDLIETYGKQTTLFKSGKYIDSNGNSSESTEMKEMMMWSDKKPNNQITLPTLSRLEKLGEVKKISGHAGELAYWINKGEFCSFYNLNSNNWVEIKNCNKPKVISIVDSPIHSELIVLGNNDGLGLYDRELNRLINPEFKSIEIIESKYYDSYNYPPHLFSVLHNSGYSGYADIRGTVYLPKDAGYIK